MFDDSLRYQKKNVQYKALKNKILRQNIILYDNKFQQLLDKLKDRIRTQTVKIKPHINKPKRPSYKVQKQLILPFQTYQYSDSQQSIKKSQQQLSPAQQTLVKNLKRFSPIYSFAKKNIFPTQNKQIRQNNQQKHIYLQNKVTQVFCKYYNLINTQQDLQNYYQAIQMQINQIMDQDNLKYLQTKIQHQITSQYLNSVYIPRINEQLDQQLFFKKQLNTIKKNQVQSLKSVLQQIKSNKKIQKLVQLTQTNTKISKQAINIEAKPSKQTNIKYDKQVSSRQGQNLNDITKVPILDLYFLNQRQSSQRQKALTSNRKRQMISSRSQQKSSSKAGRTYYYQKQKNSQNLHKKKNVSKITQAKVDYNNFKQNNQLVANRCKQQQITRYKYPLKFNENIIQASQRFKLQSQVSNQQKLNNKKIYYNPEQQKLKNQYKQNLQNVMMFEIQHLKQRLDHTINQQILLNNEYQNKFKNSQFTQKSQSLKIKQKKLKRLISQKINKFWLQSKQY